MTIQNLKLTQLCLLVNRSRRIMEVQGVQYAWAPMEGFICVSHCPPRMLS